MKKYINADLHRITSKKSFIILMVIEFAAAAGFSFLSFSGGVSGYREEIEPYIFFMPLYLGIFLYSFVLSEDFRIGTMQTAIGRGMTRPAVLAAKFIEIAVLGVVTAAIITIILIYIPCLAGSALKSRDIRALILYVLMACIRMLSCSAIGMMFLYGSMNFELSFGICLIISSGMVQLFLNYLLGLKTVQSAIGKHTAAFTLSSLTSAFLDNLGGNFIFEILRILGMAAYIAVPLFLGILLFSRKELE